MPENNIENKSVKVIKKDKSNIKPIELDKTTPVSVISVAREYNLSTNFLDPANYQSYYNNVPEVSRAIDLRGAAIIYRGYEVSSANDSKEAKRYADICAYILNKSGGVDFIEQFQKNADLFGNAYIELVTDENGKIIKLDHVHPKNFGYELETVFDNNTFSYMSKIKVDPETQQPVGYATYKFDEQKDVLVNDKIIPYDRIAHLKYKVIGDAVLGISLIQPAIFSIDNKVKMESDISDVGRLTASPKIVIQGDYPDDETAKQTIKEAASLDTNDVILIRNSDKFEIISGQGTSLPELREVFVKNIATSTGIPRPVLTSESAEINKATLIELMRNLRENMRSNMNKMRNIIINTIFYKIGINYDIPDFDTIVPQFIFPEDPDTEHEIIVREEKKAATITSLTNSLVMLNQIMMGGKNVPPNTDFKKETGDAMKSVFMTLQETIKTFSVNNDQSTDNVEEIQPEEAKSKEKPVLQLSDNVDMDEDTSIISSDVESIFSDIFTLNDTDGELNNYSVLINKHNKLHNIYQIVSDGGEIYDSETGELITLPMMAKKHQLYVKRLEHLGYIHEMMYEGHELDMFY